MRKRFHSPYPRGKKGNPFENRADVEKAAFELASVRHSEDPIAEWMATGTNN